MRAARPVSVPPRLHFIVAREARTAVVLRRGPSKRVLQLHWDLTSDTVTPGQWLIGRVYNDVCDLSPDGRLLVYFAGKFTTSMPTFTAVSRPPFFTALALWPGFGTWGGGGFFRDDQNLVLNYERAVPELDDGRGILPELRVTSLADGVSAPDTTRRAHPTIPGLVLERSPAESLTSSVHSFRLVATAEARTADGETLFSEELVDVDWAEWDHDGSLLLAAAGCLLRRQMSRSFRRVQFPAVLVADLSPHVFQNVIPPDSARQWP